MNEEKLRRGPSSQRPLKEKFDYILEVLGGSVPATLEAPPDNEPISGLVEMGLIMKRLEIGSKNVRVDGGTAEAMKSNADKIKQEAAVMGALTQTLLDGYGFEGDEGFAKYVKTWWKPRRKCGTACRTINSTSSTSRSPKSPKPASNATAITADRQ